MLGDATATAAKEPSAKSGRPAWILPVTVGVVVLAAATMLVTVNGSPQAEVPTTPVVAAVVPVDDEGQDDTDVAAGASRAPVSMATVDAQRLAHQAYASGDLATALTALETAVETDPADPAARNNLAQVMIRMGRTEDALPHLDEAVRADDTRWEYRFNRARALGLLNRWPDAVREYRAAAQIFPGDHATLYNLGLALMRVSDYPAAVTALEQAVTLAPDQHDFLISLGTASLGARQSARARAAFERFLELAPGHAEAPRVQTLLRGLAGAEPEP